MKKKYNKYQKWAKKKIGQWINGWEFIDSSFDGKITVVNYKQMITGVMATGIAYYYDGDKRSDIVAGHLADSRAQLFIIDNFLQMILEYKRFYQMLWSNKNEKLKWLELETRKFRNIIIKDIHRCQKSLDFNKKV